MKKGYKEQGFKKYNASDFNEDEGLRWSYHVDNLVIFKIANFGHKFKSMFKSRQPGNAILTLSLARNVLVDCSMFKLD